MTNINLIQTIKFPENNKKLFQVMLKKDIEGMKSIIEAGFDIHASDDKGRNLVMVAALNDDMEVFNLLVNSTGKAEDFSKIARIADVDGHTPLHYAVNIPNMGIVRSLVEDLKVNVNHQDSKGQSPIFLAHTTSHLEVARYLHTHGADLLLEDIEHNIPLLHVVQYGHFELVTFLMDTAGNVDHQNNRGDDALMISIRSGHYKIAKNLLANGCSLYNKNMNGETAMSLAKAANQTDLVERMEKQIEISEARESEDENADK